MAVKGSVSVSVVAGANTINLPKDNLLIVGFYPFSVAVSFQLTPGLVAYPPQPNPALNPAEPIIRTHYKMNSSQLIVNSTGSGTLTIYYGDAPLPESRPLESYKGVEVSVTYAAAGSTSQNITVNMPKSGGRIIGFVAWEAQTGVEYSVQFTQSTGENLIFYLTPGQMARGRDVIPLNVPDVANNFTVTVTASSTTNASVVSMVFYYQ